MHLMSVHGNKNTLHTPFVHGQQNALNAVGGARPQLGEITALFQTP